MLQVEMTVRGVAASGGPVNVGTPFWGPVDEPDRATASNFTGCATMQKANE
jgi:hypothetical protein